MRLQRLRKVTYPHAHSCGQVSGPLVQIHNPKFFPIPMQPPTPQRVRCALLGAICFSVGVQAQASPSGGSHLTSPGLVSSSVPPALLSFSDPAWHLTHRKQQSGPHQEGIHSQSLPRASCVTVRSIQATPDRHSGQPGFLWNPQNSGCTSEQTWLPVNPNVERHLMQWTEGGDYLPTGSLGISHKAYYHYFLHLITLSSIHQGFTVA